MFVFVFIKDKSEQQSAFQKCGSVKFKTDVRFEQNAASPLSSYFSLWWWLPQCACFCCSPGDPEGGAWARQEWRDGCGRHHTEERLLHRGAQSEETLTDRTEKDRKKTRGKIISKRTDSVVTSPYSSWALADPPHPHPPASPSSHPVNNIWKIVRLQNSGFLFLNLPLIKKTESNVMGGSQQHTSVFSASLSLHQLVTLKPACTYLPWKCPPPNTGLAAFQPHHREAHIHFISSWREDCSLT